MPAGRTARFAASLAGLAVAVALVRPQVPVAAAPSIPTPEQFIGFKVGADTKLARWDRIVEYMKQVAGASDRVRFRELGKTNNGNPFVMLEVASADTLKNLDRYKQYQRRLYFQNGVPSARERDEIFRQGKAVVFVGASIHATEVGATQMTLDLVHHLATDDSPATKKILDNVILLLVPSLNPDGQILITDWYNKNLGTPYESSPLPVLYHPYVGHDNNRDMYMFTQKESQYVAQVAWHDWIPAVWLDEHQMGAGGPRIFVMPATDPINPNVHPLIYRWNSIFGQSQAAALEAAGKDGIIYNSTYTNFWQGAMAWAGWWHNQIGLLTEVASARIASPTDQIKTAARTSITNDFAREAANDAVVPGLGTLGAPVDTTPRTEYPRPWMGGHWTLRDIVDYQLIATMALLDAAADRREALLRQIYEVNRQTVEEGRTSQVKAILIPLDLQQDPREALHLAERLMMGGVEVYRAEQAFELDDKPYEPGTLIIPMTQVFARYAKDLLEKQIYPEVRRAPNLPPEAPYDVTAWSLGMQFGVTLDFANEPLPNLKLTRMSGSIRMPGKVTGSGSRFTFEYTGADSAIAVNRLLKDGVKIAFTPSSHVLVDGAPRALLEDIAKDVGIGFTATEAPPPGVPDEPKQAVRMPRVALYQPWTGGNIDEGWTRWVLEQYEFPYTTIHNAEMRAGGLRRKFDAIILADQAPRDIVDGNLGSAIRPEYRGGIGDIGVDSLQRFVSDGGTLIALGAASDLVVDRFPVPVRDQKRALRRDQHFAPGTILRIQVDTSHPLGYGMAADTYGFYNNSPFFTLVDGFNANKASVIARYPNEEVVASGWLRGEDAMAGRAAVVAVDFKPGHIVLFGLRPQHRAQTHATFPMLFNALYLSADASASGTDTQQQ
ncbi:MAG: M14 metallopeptidase family protein [Vicinamibacterales bacterium]